MTPLASFGGHTIEVHFVLSALPESVAMDFVIALEGLVRAHPDGRLIAVAKTGHGSTYAAPDSTPRRKLRLFETTPRVATCDGRCRFAWGWDERPKHQRSDDPDDWEWLADDELGPAPRVEQADSDIPLQDGPVTDKLSHLWCLRYCERCHKSPHGTVVLDFSRRVRNKP